MARNWTRCRARYSIHPMRTLLATLLLCFSLWLVLCATPAAAQQQQVIPESPVDVVAIGEFAAAYATAAGGRVVAIIPARALESAAAISMHPDGLLGLARARYLVHGTETTLTPAMQRVLSTHSRARALSATLSIDPAIIRREVHELGRAMQTPTRAAIFDARFVRLLAKLRAELRQTAGPAPLRVAVHAGLQPWAALLQADVVGVFGPGTVSSVTMAQIAARYPTLVLDVTAREQAMAITEGGGARLVILPATFRDAPTLEHFFNKHGQRLVLALSAI